MKKPTAAKAKQAYGPPPGQQPPQQQAYGCRGDWTITEKGERSLP